jgi:mRNA interferase RelE/StbE
MNWEVRLSKEANCYISRLEQKRRNALLGALTGFEKNPFIGDIKPLKGRHGTYRRRVGAYRIIYSVDYEARVVKVLKIGSRGDIYK